MANKLSDENEEIHDVVDIEEYVKAGTKPPKAKKYRIRIDRDRYTVEKPLISGRELLALVSKSVAQWRIHQKLRGGQMQEVGLDQQVDLRESGVERFVTMELSQTDGEEQAAATMPPPAARRAFRLPEEDEEYLDGLGLRWETITDGGARWVLIHDHPVPDGYDTEEVIVAIRIEGGYPPGQLDMVYFYPPLARRDGREIHSPSPQPLDGVTFQRWSRHYSWRDGVDSLAIHHLRIKKWLAEEPKR